MTKPYTQNIGTQSIKPNETKYTFYCPMCGAEVQSSSEETLYKYIDAEGNIMAYSDERSKFRIQEQSNVPNGKWEVVNKSELIPHSSPCKNCTKKHIDRREAVQQEIEKGGVYYHCQVCNAQGAIKANSQMAKDIRKSRQIFAPAPTGIEFESCTQHNQDHLL